MERDDLTRQIDQIMVEGFEIAPSLLKPEARLFEDLGLDSLDGVDLVVAIEKKFSCRIEETDVRSMRSLSDIYEYVRKTLSEKGRKG